MSTLYYRNPRLLVLTLAVILVAGLSAFVLLPRKEDPSLKQRFALVTTRFPGADAEQVELLVTRKLEDALREFDEIERVQSTSRSGISLFDLRLYDAISDVAEVWSKVRDKLDDVAPDLPPGCEDPQFRERESQVDAYTLIVGLSWQLETPMPHGHLRRLAEDLEDVFQAQPGTRDTKIFGDLREEILVEVEANRLADLGMSAAQLSHEIARADAKVPAGQLRGARQDLLIEVAGELDSLQRIAELPVKVGSRGQMLRLGDLAEVRKTVAAPTTELALISGQKGFAIAARMGDGVQIEDWAAGSHAALEQFQRELPRGVELTLLFDQSRYVEERLGNLAGNLVLGAVLVVAVIFFMMGWKSALLVSSALPLASLLVLEGLQLLEIPIHQMSITGLIIALGLLIDNAIIMVDEVSSRLRQGMSPEEAVGATTRALGVPLLGSTLTTVFAFMPLVLMPGGAGEFVSALGISVILALFSSLFVSLSIVPAVTALFKSSDLKTQRSFLRDGFSSAPLTRLYTWSLRQLTRRPLLFVILACLLPVLGFWGGSTLREQFFPPSDRDTFQIQMFLPPQASFEETWRAAETARAEILADPAIADVHWFVGGNAPKFYYNVRGGKDGATYYAQALVQLKPGFDATPVVQRLQPALDAKLPHAQSIVQLLEQGPPFDAPIELHVYGPDLDQLDALGEHLRTLLAGLPEVNHTRLTLSSDLPKLVLEVSETDLRMVGLSNLDLAEQLQSTLEGSVGGSLLEDTEELPVRVRVSEQARGALARIEALDIATRQPSGAGPQTLPISVLGRLAVEPERASISRRNGERLNTLQGFLQAGVLAAPVLEAFKQRLAAESLALPAGYRIEFGGESQERNRAVGNLMAYVGLLLVLMVATLVLSFNSFRMAGIIGMVGVFSTGLALGALWLFGYPFGFMAIVGAMGLVGVAVNDSIVVLSALRAHPAARLGDPQAVVEVVLHSTRHVISTSVTTMAGFLPLLLDGGQFWPPLATAIACGVAGATVLGLYFVPASYLLLLRWGKCPQKV